MCFGSGSSNKNYLMDTLKQLISTSQTKQNEALDPLTAYSKTLMTSGLPDFQQQKDLTSGVVAQNTAPARAQVMRNLARSGMKMTDPAAQATVGDFEASRARAYDTNLAGLLQQNQAAKQAGAQNLAAVGSARSPYAYLNLFGQALNA